jgi:hypothetical protein
MGILLIAVLIGLLPAVIAQGKGRSFVLWWIYGALLFIVALPHSLMMADQTPAPSGRVYRPAAKPPANLKRCPDCAEMVQADARICRFCRHEFSAPTPAATKPSGDALARLMPFPAADDWTPAPRAEAELPPPGTRICPICHRHNPPELDACAGCGARLRPRSA